MGADDDINAALVDSPDGVRRIFRITGKQADAHGEAGKPLLKGLIVLPGEKRRRHQHRHLLGIHHGLKAGPHGHLGLAIAHISQEQAVHDLSALHISLDLGDALGLPGGFLISKAVLKLALPDGILGEAVSLAGSPLPIQRHQILCQLLDG